MPKYRSGISPKQEAFVQELIRNGGNQTQAALKVYNTDDYLVANNIGSENLAKPSVINRIKQLSAENIKSEDVINKLIQHMNDEEKPVSLKACELIGKYFKLFTDKTETTHKLEGITSIKWLD